jgi:hypothetical protein
MMTLSYTECTINATDLATCLLPGERREAGEAVYDRSIAKSLFLHFFVIFQAISFWFWFLSPCAPFVATDQDAQDGLITAVVDPR